MASQVTLNALGGFLGTFLGSKEAHSRKQAMDADIIAAGDDPLAKMNAVAKHQPELWASPQFIAQHAQAQEYVDKQKAAELQAQKQAGFDVLLGSLPAEQRPAAIRDWGAGIVPDNQYQAATNQQFQTTGNQNAIEAATVADTRDQAKATTLFGRQQDTAKLEAKLSDQNNANQSARQLSVQKTMADYNNAIEQGKPAKAPAGYGVSATGRLIPKEGTAEHTAVVDRVAKTNKAMTALEQYKSLLNNTSLVGLTGADKAKAQALRSSIATGVMLAANGKSDADYQIALSRVPAIDETFTRNSSSAQVIDVLNQELAADNENNKKLFGEVAGVKPFTPMADTLPAGFRVVTKKVSK